MGTDYISKDLGFEKGDPFLLKNIFKHDRLDADDCYVHGRSDMLIFRQKLTETLPFRLITIASGGNSLFELNDNGPQCLGIDMEEVDELLAWRFFGRLCSLIIFIQHGGNRREIIGDRSFLLLFQLLYG